MEVIEVDYKKPIAKNLDVWSGHADDDGWGDMSLYWKNWKNRWDEQRRKEILKEFGW